MYTGLAVVPAEEPARRRVSACRRESAKGRLGRWTNVVILGAQHVEWRATEAFQQDMPGDLCEVADFIGDRSVTLAC